MASRLIAKNGGMGTEPTTLRVPTVLCVDDEAAIIESLSTIFRKEGLRVLQARDGKAALELLRREAVDVLLTDLTMPGMDGMDLLRASRTVAPETEVILMTAYGTVDRAVEAMKEGAYDFVTKPLRRAQIVRSVEKAMERHRLTAENRELRARLEERDRPALIGASMAWRRTLETVRQAAPSAATVLLLGESGTGKELLARALHAESTRAGGPFVAVSCAAIPETILEAELFGHEKGAFTGAVAARPGRFALADGGTLFLDEIGELSPQVQVKLLRVLQEGEIERLGGSTHRVDIRLVAATNRDLPRAVREGRFRDDLYYRLNVIAVRVPPLRERPEDVPVLAQHFLRAYAERNGKTVSGFSRDALARLAAHAWPGNVRELENAVERAVVLGRGPLVEVADLPPDLGDGAGASGFVTVPIGTPLDEVERRLVHETLRHTRGDKRLCAQLLGVATRTIYRRLQEERPEGAPCGDERPEGAAGDERLAEAAGDSAGDGAGGAAADDAPDGDSPPGQTGNETAEPA